MALPQLVIFDCDGILVDTENPGNRGLAEWLTEAGFPVTFEYCRRNFSGCGVASVYDEVIASGVDLAADFVERWNLGFPDLFARASRRYHNVRQVIEAIRTARIAYCVATSARLTKMQLTHGTTGLLSHFETRHVQCLDGRTRQAVSRSVSACGQDLGFCLPTALSSRTAYQELRPARPPAWRFARIAPIRCRIATGLPRGWHPLRRHARFVSNDRSGPIQHGCRYLIAR
jgi:hypothetical protein